VKLVLDSGALIALERNDPAMWRWLKSALVQEQVPVCHGGNVGQAWRGAGSRHASLARAIAAIDVRPLDESLGRAAGELLARSGTSDVIDAAVVLLCEDGDFLLTSDPDELELLASLSGRHVELIPV
jgi:hypothetical protein